MESDEPDEAWKRSGGKLDQESEIQVLKNFLKLFLGDDKRAMEGTELFTRIGKRTFSVMAY